MTQKVTVGTVWLAFLLLAQFVAGPSAQGAEEDRPLNIVVLSSANFLLPASLLQDQSLRDALVAGSSRPIVFFPETIDTIKLDGAGYEPEYAAYLQKKYEHVKVDLVMPMGAYALGFVERHRTDLWSKAPVVFYGVDALLMRNRKLGSGFTGQTMAFDLDGTIGMAKRLHPGLRRLAVISGVADYDRYWLPLTSAALQPYFGKLETIWLTNQTMPQLLETVGGLSNDTAIFFTSFQRDPSGQTYVSRDAAATVAKAAAVPLYSPSETYLGWGSVGGSIASFKEQGEAAAKLALKVLAGARPEDLGVQPAQPSRMMVDWRLVRRWNIDPQLLPAGTRVLFQEPNFWEAHGKLILIGVALAGAQALLIAALLIGRARRLGYQRELRERLKFEQFIADLSAKLINVSSDEVDSVVSEGLKKLLLITGLDRCCLFNFNPGKGYARVTHCAQTSGAPAGPLPFSEFPWLWSQLTSRHAVAISDAEIDLPKAAGGERAYLTNLGTKAVLVLHLDQQSGWGISFHRKQAQRWAEDWVTRLRIFGEILVSALTRNRAEAALRSSEELYREVVETQTDLVCRFKPDTTLTFVNEAYCRMFRCSRDELIGWKFLDLVPAESRHAVWENLARLTREQPVLTHEHEVSLPDGRLGWQQWINHAIVDADGQVTEYQAIGRDITERKEAEHRMRESEARFVHMANSAPVLIWASGVNKQCMFFNKPWLDFTGRGLEQEIGNGWAQGVHPDDRDRWEAVFHEAFDARRPFSREYRLRRHDGEYRWVLDHGVPRRDPHGNFLGYIGSAVDVTDRRRADEKFRLAVEAAPNGVILASEHGIILVNAQVEQMFGYRREELIGKPAKEILPEINFFELAATNGETPPASRNREMAGRKKDGTVFPLEIGVNPIQSEEGGLALAVLADLTARKVAESESVRQRMELAHVARVSTLGALAGSLAHELNQPLSAILSNAQAGSRFLARPDPDLEEIRNVLRDIAHDTKRAGEVIRHMRALVKKDEPNFEPLDINRVIQDVVRLLNSDILIRKVRVDLELGTALPPAHGDSVQIQQVVLNLVLNGFDAMRDTPENQRAVRIRTRKLDSGNIMVQIRDHGSGLPLTRLDRLFEPFQSSKPDGLGLGLSISRSIVEAHRGQICAENNSDRGATFYFTLPIHDESLNPEPRS